MFSPKFSGFFFCEFRFEKLLNFTVLFPMFLCFGRDIGCASLMRVQFFGALCEFRIENSYNFFPMILCMGPDLVSFLYHDVCSHLFIFLVNLG